MTEMTDLNGRFKIAIILMSEDENQRKISVVTVFMIARIHRDKRTCERVGQWSDGLMSGRTAGRTTGCA